MILIASAEAHSQVLVTNYVTAHPDFRVVNGTLYNVAKSDRWEWVAGKVTAIQGSNVVVALEYRNDLKEVYLTNYPMNPLPVAGQKISAMAMKTGVIKDRIWTYELYDHGTPHRVPVVTTHHPPKLK